MKLWCCLHVMHLGNQNCGLRWWFWLSLSISFDLTTKICCYQSGSFLFSCTPFACRRFLNGSWPSHALWCMQKKCKHLQCRCTHSSGTCFFPETLPSGTANSKPLILPHWWKNDESTTFLLPLGNFQMAPELEQFCCNRQLQKTDPIQGLEPPAPLITTGTTTEFEWKSTSHTIAFVWSSK